MKVENLLKQLSSGDKGHHNTDILCLVELQNHILASSAVGGGLCLWDLKEGKFLCPMPGHTSGVCGMTVLPDGRLVSTCVGESNLRVWRTQGLTPASATRDIKYDSYPLPAPVANLILLDDDITLAISLLGDKYGQICFFNTVTHRCTDPIQAHSTDGGYGMALLPTGELASTFNDSTVKIWTSHTTYDQLQPSADDKTGALMVTLDGALVRGSGQGTIHICDTQLKSCIRSFKEHNGSYNHNAIVMLENGTLISASCGNKSVRLWRFAQRPLEFKDIKLILKALKDETINSVKTLNLNGVTLGKQGADELINIVVKNKSLVALDVRNTGLTAKDTHKLVSAIKKHPTLCIFEYSEDIFNPCLTTEEQEELRSLLISRQKEVANSQSLPQFFTPDVSAPTLGLTQYQAAKEKWTDAFKDTKLVGKIEDISLKTMKSILSTNLTFNPLQYDLAIISELSKTLDTTEKQLFISHAQSTLGAYSSQLHALQNVVGNSGFVSLAEDLNKMVTDVGSGKEIDMSINAMLKTIKNYAEDEVFHKNIISATERLFNCVDDTSKRFLDLNQLKDTLFELNTDPIANKLQILDTKFQIQGIEKAIEKFAGQGINFKTLSQGFDAIGSVLNIVGVSPQLSNQIVTVGKATITITQSIGMIAAGTAVLGPIGAIGGAIAAIFSVFNSGPSNEEKMLIRISEQINKVAEHIDKRFNHLQMVISETVTRLAKHIDARFDHMEGILNAMAVHQDRRFDRVEWKLDKIYIDCMNKLKDLGKELKAIGNQIDKRLQCIDQIVQRIEDKIDTYAKEANEKEYRKLKRDAFHAFFDAPDISSANKHAGDLADWAVNISKSAALSGIDDSNLKQIEVCRNILKNGIAFKVNLLITSVAWANTSLTNKDKVKLSQGIFSNPQIWIDATRNYMRFIYQCTALASIRKNNFSLSDEFISGYKTDIQRIEKVGLELKEFIRSIKTNKAFFIQLCNSYRDCLQAILNKMTEGWNNKVQDLLKPELEDLEVAYNLLHIFSAFAFQQDCSQDLILRSYLHTRLWDNKQLECFLRLVETGDSFILKTIGKNLLCSIDGLENLLLDKIVLAEHDPEKNTGFSLLDITLQELKIFTTMLPEPKPSLQLQQLSAQTEPKPFSLDEFKGKLSKAIGEYAFKFDITSEVTDKGERKIIIAFDDDSVSVDDDIIQKTLNGLVEDLRKSIKTLSFQNEDIQKIIGYSKKDKRVTIICKNTASMDQILHMLQEISGEHLRGEPKALNSLFFRTSQTKDVTGEDKKKEKQEDTVITCPMQ